MEKPELLEITKNSFFYVFYFELFAFTVTLIALALVDSDESRRILFLELLVTLISSIMYYLFITDISKHFDLNEKPDLTFIDRLRYKGWAITTPIMLISLCILLHQSSKVPLTAFFLFTILVLDYIMLFLGFLGEINVLDRITAMILGFVPFFIIFYMIYSTFLVRKTTVFNYWIFAIYFFIWTGYGVSYLFDEDIKNILTNIFDCISKGVIAILLSGKFLFF
jgi:bacteriorhodopsin